jgi:hypothetical protein
MSNNLNSNSSKLVELWQKPISEIVNILEQYGVQPYEDSEVKNYLELTFILDSMFLFDEEEHQIINDPRFIGAAELTEDFFDTQRLSIALDLMGKNTSSIKSPKYHYGRAFASNGYNRTNDPVGLGFDFSYDIIELDLSEKDLVNEQLKDYIFPYTVKKIYLNGNNLTTLRGINFPEFLEELYVAHNRLESLDGLNVPTLKILDVTGNNIRSLSSLILHPKLEILYLGYNNIERIDTRFPLSLIKLEINNNKLTEISDLRYLNNLYELNIRGNNIRYINRENIPISVINLLI